MPSPMPEALRPAVFPFPAGTRVIVGPNPTMPGGGGVHFRPAGQRDIPVIGTITDYPAYQSPWEYPGVRVTADYPQDGVRRDYVEQYVCPSFLTLAMPLVSLRHPDRHPLCTLCETEPQDPRTGEMGACTECASPCEAAGCGSWFPEREGTPVFTSNYSYTVSYYCDSCTSNSRVRVCEHNCGNYVLRSAARHCDDCGYVCVECADSLNYCDGCEQSYCSDYHDECNSEDDDDYYGESYSSGGSSILSYSHRPILNFNGTGTTYFGAEIEINAAGKLADYITTKAAGLIYCKEDSSVTRGFEMVTHPMTYEWFMGNFPFDAIRHMAGEGAKAGQHGIHVHVNRTAFAGPTHVKRWLDFLYAEENRASVIGIARRESTEWASFGDIRYNEEKASGSPGCGRYYFVNALNDATFEVRGFASSLDPEEIQAAIGLVSASVEYTRGLPDTLPGLGEMKWDHFAGWVADRPEYAPLSAQITKRTEVTAQTALDLVSAAA